MNAFHNHTLSGGVIGLLRIKTYSHYVLIFYKTLTDIRLQPNQRICDVLTFLRPTLVFGNDFVLCGTIKVPSLAIHPKSMAGPVEVAASLGCSL